MSYLVIFMPALVIWRAVLPLKVSKYSKVLLTVAVLLAAFKFQIIYALGGPMFFAPDVPPWVLVTGNLLYGWSFFFFFLLAISEIILLIWRVIAHLRKKKLSEKFRKYNNRLNLILLITALLLTLYALYEGACQPRVKEFTYTSQAIPAAADGIRIAVLADLHIDVLTRAPRIRKIVAKTNALQPDLTVIVGDIVDGTVAQRSKDVSVLNELAAPLGIYAVAGNHEYFSGYSEWMEFFKSSKIRMLENSSVKLPNNIYIAGVTDFMARKRSLPLPDARKALQNILPEEFVIYLAHRPGEAAKAAPLGADLQFSGHTHGGMIWGFDRIVGRFNDNFYSGWYKLGTLDLYVSNGTAIWNGFPFRLGRASEITLITLKSIKQEE